MRCFIALPVPGELGRKLAALGANVPVGRLVPMENYHITLAFLDEQDDETLAALHDELSVITAMPIYAEVTGLSVFGSKTPKLLAADINKTIKLDNLCREVRRAARAVGISLKSSESFRPHITLSRFSPKLTGGEEAQLAGFMQSHASWQFDPVICEVFSAYRSVLGPDGPSYTRLADYALAGHF